MFEPSIKSTNVKLCISKHYKKLINTLLITFSYNSRRKKWLEVIGRPDLLNRSDLRPHSYCVCSAHFESSVLSTKLYLTHDAVPTKLLPTSKKDADNNQSTQTEESSDNLSRKSVSPIFDDSEKIEPEEKNLFLKLVEWEDKIKKLDGAEYKSFVLNLYFASPHTYRLLKSLFQLPNVSALHRFHVKIPLKLNDRVMTYLSLKMKSFPNQAKYCTICLGEMKLKPHLYYDTKEDDVIGFHSINGKTTNKLANRAYVIMLQGIFHKWRQLLAYALVPDLEHYDDLGCWIHDIISMLYEIGIEVKAVISDQDSNFDKFAKEVKEVTIEKPYFFVEDRKVYYIFNVPLLLCSVRDQLMKCDYEFEGNVISWKYLEMLYIKESERGLRLIPKITVAHLNPDNYLFHKPRVELAAQVFSQTVSAALDTHIDFKSLPTAARATARFVQTMDNIFDVLNSSKVRSDKPLQLAYKDTDDQRYVLQEALTMFSEIKPKPTKLQHSDVIESGTKTFNNFQITIQSILLLFQDLNDQLFEQVFTRRLNKDNLEVVLGSIVWQEDSGTEPTPIKFSIAFSKLFLSNMLQNTPCQCINILPKADQVLLEAFNSTKEDETIKSLVNLSFLNSIDYKMELPAANALTYISGYLLYKCFEKHRCSGLAYIMLEGPSIETGRLAYYKDLNSNASFYQKLKMPPYIFIDYVEKLEMAFVRNCALLTLESPGSSMFVSLKAIQPMMLCECFPIDLCIQVFVRLRIYTTLKYMQKEIKNGSKVISVEHL